MGKLEFWNLSGVSDEHLLQDLRGFIASGARLDARLVAHLAEVEERRLHLKAAASSLFDYCLRRLGLSESEAFYRITAARLARKFPVIFGLLENRSIHLSALRVLRDHLTSENHRELLAAASGKSKKEVEVLVAALAPRPDVVSRIRKLPAARRAPQSPSETVAVAALAPESNRACSQPLGHDLAPANVAKVSSSSDRGPLAVGASGERVAKASSSSGREPLSLSPLEMALGASGERVGGAARSAQSWIGARALEPLSSTRYLLRMSVSGEFKDKLERARELMSHANPSGELARVLERALDLLLEKLEKQRFARTERPRHSPQRAEVAKEESRRRESPRFHGREGSEPEDARASSGRGKAPRRLARAVSLRASGAPSAGVSAASGVEGIVRGAPGAQRTRREHIPNEVRRTVAKRDGFQCTYVDDEGRRCPTRAFLQLHHEHAHALGGVSTFENLRLLCGSHNRLLAEQDFGRAYQARIIRRKSGSTPDSKAP